MKTASIIIIGNEILSGRTEDRNSSYLCSQLRELGVDVRRIAVIPDDADTIGKEVSSASASYDFVFTSGGVGPTHDDVTMEGIALGFGVRLVRNPRLWDVIRARCGGEDDDPAAKMAFVPDGAELIEAEGLGFPGVFFRNVYIFPGIPEFLVKKFSAIRERFRSSPFVLRKLYLDEEECNLARHLSRIASEFRDVMVGSYPYVGNPEYRVIVTLESRDAGSVGRAYDMLVGLLPPRAVVKTE